MFSSSPLFTVQTNCIIPIRVLFGSGPLFISDEYARNLKQIFINLSTEKSTVKLPVNYQYYEACIVAIPRLYYTNTAFYKFQLCFLVVLALQYRLPVYYKS